jgi:hypothetical protein
LEWLLGAAGAATTTNFVDVRTTRNHVLKTQV